MKAIHRSLRGNATNSRPIIHSNLTSGQTRLPLCRTYTRPAFAPKPTIDIKHIRQNPGLYEQNCIDRNYAAHSKSSWRIIELHEQWLALQKSSRDLRERNNQLRVQLSK